MINVFFLVGQNLCCTFVIEYYIIYLFRVVGVVVVVADANATAAA